MGRQSPLTIANRNSALADREAVLARMNPALKSVFAELQGRMVEKIEDNLRFYHQLGKTCLDIKKNPDKYLTDEQKLQGVDPIDLLQEASSTSKQTFSRTAQFAERYDAEDLKRLFGYRNAEDTKWRLHWGHVSYLISIPDVRARLKFEEDTVANLWEPSDLLKAVQAHFGEKRSKGARPFAIPRTVPSQISQIRNVSSQWIRKNQAIWNGEKNNVFNNILQLDPSKYTPDMLTSLRGLQLDLQTMAEQIEADRQVLAGVLPQVEQGLAAPPAAPSAPAQSPKAGKAPAKAPAAKAPAPAAKPTKPPAAAAKPVAAKQTAGTAVASKVRGSVSPSARAKAVAGRVLSNRPSPR